MHIAARLNHIVVFASENDDVAHLSRIMRKTTFFMCENKGADQLGSNCKADHTFVFATHILQFLYFLNPKFPASSHLLCLYSSVCVEPVQKPHSWFPHDTAHLFYTSCVNLLSQFLAIKEKLIQLE